MEPLTIRLLAPFNLWSCSVTACPLKTLKHNKAPSSQVQFSTVLVSSSITSLLPEVCRRRRQGVRPAPRPLVAAPSRLAVASLSVAWPTPVLDSLLDAWLTPTPNSVLAAR